MSKILLGFVFFALLFYGCCSSTVPSSISSSDIGADTAINATLNDLCGFGNTTTQGAINRDGVHQVGSRSRPLRVGAYKYQWKSESDTSLKADGYKIIVYYTGENGEVEYDFHWDGEFVRYMNPAAHRALSACE